MARRFINIMAICLFPMIIGTIIASPLDLMKEHFGDHFLDVILEIINTNSPNLYGYKHAQLVDVRSVLNERGLPIFRISVLVEPKCDPMKFKCQREICTMIIEKDESNNLMVDHQPIRCFHQQHETTPKPVEKHVEKKVVDESNDSDEIMKKTSNEDLKDSLSGS